MKKKAQISLIIAVIWFAVSQAVAAKLNISLVNTWAAWAGLTIGSIPIEFALHFGIKHLEEYHQSGVIILRLILIVIPIILFLNLFILLGTNGVPKI